MAQEEPKPPIIFDVVVDVGHMEGDRFEITYSPILQAIATANATPIFIEGVATSCKDALKNRHLSLKTKGNEELDLEKVSFNGKYVEFIGKPKLFSTIHLRVQMYCRLYCERA